MTTEITKTFHIFWWPMWIMCIAGMITYPHDFGDFWLTVGAILLLMLFFIATVSIYLSLRAWAEWANS